MEMRRGELTLSTLSILIIPKFTTMYKIHHHVSKHSATTVFLYRISHTLLPYIPL